MTRAEFHTELQKYLYIEDMGMVDVILASIVANSLQIGDPVWLTIIGPSSGGKSQIIRPFAQGNSSYIHRIDDLTPNTLLSGSLGLEGSLLGRIGSAGIISMDDLTVLFSKNAEQRGEILSQFRMIYDGHFSKSSGNRKEDISWRGYVGMIAGSTPSIYRYFNEVADMGERFINYRMKKIDIKKAVEFVTANPYTSTELNNHLSELTREFIPPLVQSLPHKSDIPPLHDETKHIIQEASHHMTLLRTPIHIDERSGLVDEFPEPEMPFRVMKQLTYLARGMQCIAPDPSAPLPEDMTRALQWTAYSLANDKRRAFLGAVVALSSQAKKITARNVASITGMHPDIAARGLAQLQALQIIEMLDDSDSTRREWRITNHEMCRLVRQIEPMEIAEDLLDEV